MILFVSENRLASLDSTHWQQCANWLWLGLPLVLVVGECSKSSKANENAHGADKSDRNLKGDGGDDDGKDSANAIESGMVNHRNARKNKG
jgi:hypothetical protein